MRYNPFAYECQHQHVAIRFSELPCPLCEQLAVWEHVRETDKFHAQDDLAAERRAALAPQPEQADDLD